MEFYKARQFVAEMNCICFNSQRDGILPYTLIAFIHRRRFQFPTGWNSTLSLISILSRFRFQFPTGWNSTLVKNLGSSTNNFSFNSQRDGILLWTEKLFPSFRNCFNSQRDGILLFDGANFVNKPKFQFPTGWNSTYMLLVG